MQNYQDAAEYLAGGRSTDRRPLSGRASEVHRLEDGRIAVRYQATDVVIYRPDGTTELHTGGWQTATTKERINTYSRARVSSDKGVWYVMGPSRWDRKDATLFYDGMIVDAEGQPITPKVTTPATEAAKVLDKLITRYIRGYAAEVCKPEAFPEPSGGDCWGCYFSLQGANGHTRTGHLDARGGYQDTTGSADPLGIDHLLDHFTDQYYVPSLYARACVEAGYGGGPGIGWQMGIVRKDRQWITRELRRYFRQPQRRAALIAAVQAEEVQP
jgi:hypothetical protein